MTAQLDPDPLVPLDYDVIWAEGYVAGWDDAPATRQPGSRFWPLGLVAALAAGILIGYLVRPVAAATPRSAAVIPSGGSVERPASVRGPETDQQPTGAPQPSPIPVSGGAPAAPRTLGIASWYDDGPGLYGAVPSWHFGDRPYQVDVVAGARRVRVTVRDFCGCPGGRVIDLSPAAFRQLAPLSRGIVRVSVQRAGPVPTPPATDH